MQYTKEIGFYNVSINDGNLNHRDNRWYYSLQIDLIKQTSGLKAISST